MTRPGAATAYSPPQRAVAAAIISMTSNIMILPLPVYKKASKRLGTRGPGHFLRMWGMVPGTPLAYLHLHFSDVERCVGEKGRAAAILA